MPTSAISPPKKEHQESGEHTSYGQVIEYIRDRLYLASYTHPPTSSTPFPYLSNSSPSPSKRRSKHSSTPTPVETNPPLQPVYFSVDDILLYNAFHADFGPLHIGHLYRFSVYLHEILAHPENQDSAVVFWSRADSRSRANATCILASYMVLVQEWPPHLALAPIAQMDPPCMPFRDAGYSQADYILTIQDIVYGIWRAKQEKLVGFAGFNLQEYERYERVDMGDFNWVTPNFVAFASPQHQPIAPISRNDPAYASLPKNTSEIYHSTLPQPFKMVLGHFRAKKVGLVVRLNSELYSPSYFTAIGITHYDMIFDDGTCPPLALVRKFIKLAHEMITVKRRHIAVHCKAGLGRTGCLIGAYLIYRHGFTANECMAYMRFMRPGMVVGPQQHWLHLNQGAFREWWFEDAMKDKMALLAAKADPKPTAVSTPPQKAHRLASNGQTFTPPNGITGVKRQALGELDDTNHRRISVQGASIHDENLPAPTPGQPRKTSKSYGERHNPYTDTENEPVLPDPETEIVSMTRHQPSAKSSTATGTTATDSESEEELQLRLLAKRSSPSLQLLSSPEKIASMKQRAVSCAVTPSGAVSPMRKLSGNGAGALSVHKREGSAFKRATTGPNGVRKSSAARVASSGAIASGLRVKQ